MPLSGISKNINQIPACLPTKAGYKHAGITILIWIITVERNKNNYK